MPTLKPYEAGVQGLRPTETGVEATAAAARRVGGAYSEAAESTKEAGRIIGGAIAQTGQVFVDHLARMEINRAAPAWAAMQLSLSEQWKGIHEADQDNPTSGPKFREDLEGRLQQFRSQFFTTEAQDWAEKRIDSFREEMYTKTQADASKGHGNQAVINADQALTLTEHRAVNAGDENTTRIALKDWRDTATRMHLPEKSIVEGEDRIVFGGISGAIQNGKGQLGVDSDELKWAKKDEFAKHWNAIDDRKKFDALQKTVDTQERVAAKGKEAQHKKAVLTEYNGMIDDLETKMLPTDGSNPVIPTNEQLTKVRQHEGANYAPGSYRALLSKANTLAERLNKADTPDNVSKPNMIDIWNQMTPGKDFAEYIDSNFRAGNINQAHWNFLHQRWRELQTEDGKDFAEQRKHFFAGVQEAIAPPLGDVTDNTTKTRMSNFALAFERRKAELVKQGEDPMQLMDPDSEFYMGGANTLRGYLPPSMQRRLQTAPQPQQPPAQQQPPPTAAPTPVPTTTVRRPGTAAAAPAPAPAQPQQRDVIKPGDDLDDWVRRNPGGR